MKNLAIFTAWVLGAVLTAVIPAAIISALSPATYNDIMSSPMYIAITALFGTCLIGVCVAEEVNDYFEK